MNTHPVALGHSARTQLVVEAENLLLAASHQLDKLANACCQPERSESMRKATIRLAESTALLKTAQQRDAKALIDALGKFGAHIGKMAVTCCDEQRAPVYHQILEKSASAYLLIAQASGQAH